MPSHISREVISRTPVLFLHCKFKKSLLNCLSFLTFIEYPYYWLSCDSISDRTFSFSCFIFKTTSPKRSFRQILQKTKLFEVDKIPDMYFHVECKLCTSLLLCEYNFVIHRVLSLQFSLLKGYLDPENLKWNLHVAICIPCNIFPRYMYL